MNFQKKCKVRVIFMSVFCKVGGLYSQRIQDNRSFSLVIATVDQVMTTRFNFI